MPCILKSLHKPGGYYNNQPFCARPRLAARDNPGIIAHGSRDVAFLALLIVFFALLGTVLVLLAVYLSKRKLDKECLEQISQDRLHGLQAQQKGVRTPSWSSTDMKAQKSFYAPSYRSTITRSSVGSAGYELPQLPPSKDLPGTPTTIRGRRGMPELSVRYDSSAENWRPRFPEPAHRSGVSAVFPGVLRYGMSQLGNDGKVHRPESIFEHLRP